jgi:hypothetical protein
MENQNHELENFYKLVESLNKLTMKEIKYLNQEILIFLERIKKLELKDEDNENYKKDEYELITENSYSDIRPLIFESKK